MDVLGRWSAPTGDASHLKQVCRRFLPHTPCCLRELHSLLLLLLEEHGPERPPPLSLPLCLSVHIMLCIISYLSSYIPISHVDPSFHPSICHYINIASSFISLLSIHPSLIILILSIHLSWIDPSLITSIHLIHSSISHYLLISQYINLIHPSLMNGPISHRIHLIHLWFCLWGNTLYIQS